MKMKQRATAAPWVCIILGASLAALGGCGTTGFTVNYQSRIGAEVDVPQASTVALEVTATPPETSTTNEALITRFPVRAGGGSGTPQAGPRGVAGQRRLRDHHRASL